MAGHGTRARSTAQGVPHMKGDLEGPDPIARNMPVYILNSAGACSRSLPDRERSDMI